MAAHDDKISSNRRKLFKALSAAPVVMTLRPGAALANASAYQCLNNPSTPADYLPNTSANTATCNIGEECFAYQEKRYWNVDDGTKVAGVDSNTANWPQEVRDLLGLTLVETELGTYITLGSDVINSDLLDLYGDGKLRIKDLQGTAYLEEIPARTGLFLVLVEPLDDGTRIDIAGIYPAQTQTGSLQGITGTCLASIHPGTTGVVIARG